MMKTKDQFWQENKTSDAWEMFSKTWNYFNKRDVWLKPGKITREAFVQDIPDGNAAAYVTPGYFNYELRYKDAGIFKYAMLRHGFRVYKIDEDVLLCNCLDLTKQLIATGQFSERSYFYPEHELSVLQFRN